MNEQEAKKEFNKIMNKLNELSPNNHYKSYISDNELFNKALDIFIQADIGQEYFKIMEN